MSNENKKKGLIPLKFKRISSVGKRMESLMTEKEITLRHIAEKTGISKSSIDRYKKDEILPKQPEIESLSRFFNVSPAWLMGYDVDKRPEIGRMESIEKELSRYAKKLMQLNDKEVNKLFKHIEETINLYISAKGE